MVSSKKDTEGLSFDDRAYLDNLTCELSPWSQKILNEHREQLEQAVHHITGSTIIPDVHMKKLFGWIKVHKHPVSGVLDTTKEYDILAYFGDGFEEILQGKKEPIALLWRFQAEPTVIIDPDDPGKIIDVVNNIVRVYSERQLGSDD